MCVCVRVVSGKNNNKLKLVLLFSIFMLVALKMGWLSVCVYHIEDESDKISTINLQ